MILIEIAEKIKFRSTRFKKIKNSIVYQNLPTSSYCIELSIFQVINWPYS